MLLTPRIAEKLVTSSISRLRKPACAQCARLHNNGTTQRLKGSVKPIYLGETAPPKKRTFYRKAFKHENKPKSGAKVLLRPTWADELLEALSTEKNSSHSQQAHQQGSSSKTSAYSWDEISAIFLDASEPFSRRIQVARQAFTYVIEGSPSTLPPYEFFFKLQNTPVTSLKESKELLRFFNGTFAWIEEHASSHLRVLARSGLFVAAQAYSVTSFQYYLDHVLGDLQTDRDDTRLAALLGPALRELYGHIEADSFEDWAGARRKELLEAIFRQALDLAKPGNAIYKPLFGLSIAQLDIAQYTAYTLGRLYGPEAVLESWEINLNNFNSKLYETSEGRYDQLQAKILQFHVEALIWNGHPETAWNLVRGLGWQPSEIRDETWKMLLDYPEYLTEWEEAMAEPVLKKYEQYIQNIENTLGVKWTGGEDGQHVFVDDEGYEELIPKELIEEKSG